MFSGIVAATGRILQVAPLEDGVRLSVDVGTLDLDDVQLGDSIANNGVCLTVIAQDGKVVSFDVSRETLNCTVGLDAPGEVNLEKALRLADRLGGLPPYEVLDAILQRYMEEDQSIDEIVAAGFPVADVERVTHLIKVNEYKRRQSPVGIRITHRSFGKDWRYPITSKFRA